MAIVFDASLSSPFLSHEGVRGRSGRYPLGSGERPYQREERGRRKAALRKAKKDLKKQKREAKRLQRDADKAKKVAEDAQRQEEDYEARKKRLLEKGTASEILAFEGVLTARELQNAYDRIQWTQKLQEASKKEMENGFDKVDKAVKKIGTVSGWIKTGTDLYGNVAAAKKIFDDLSKQAATANKKVKAKQAKQAAKQK